MKRRGNQATWPLRTPSSPKRLLSRAHCESKVEGVDPAELAKLFCTTSVKGKKEVEREAEEKALPLAPVAPAAAEPPEAEEEDWERLDASTASPSSVHRTEGVEEEKELSEEVGSVGERRWG